MSFALLRYHKRGGVAEAPEIKVSTVNDKQDREQDGRKSWSRRSGDEQERNNDGSGR